MKTQEARKGVKKAGARGNSSGFTLLELLIVLAIVALTAAFAMPKYARQIDKAKVADAFNALGNLASQVEGACASSFPSTLPANLTAMTETPDGFKSPVLASGSGCDSYTVKLPPVAGSNLPQLCAGKAGGAVKFGFSGTGWEDDDIPLPASKLGAACS